MSHAGKRNQRRFIPSEIRALGLDGGLPIPPNRSRFAPMFRLETGMGKASYPQIFPKLIAAFAVFTGDVEVLPV